MVHRLLPLVAAAAVSFSALAQPMNPVGPAPVPADGSAAAALQQRDDRALRTLRSQAHTDLAEQVAWAVRIKLGDPHKYILPGVAARLAFDPADKAAWDAYRGMIDSDKEKASHDKGIYHFAVLPKARIFFQFQKSLPPDVARWIESNEAANLEKFRAGGTENHMMMTRTAGYLFADRFPTAPDADKHKRWLADWLRAESKKLYTVGQGEWDSSTYVAFSAGGWANVYDFAADPAMRDVAKATLDFYAASQAIKYFHGLNAGPEARGYASQVAESNSDALNWVWWGGAPDDAKVDTAGRNFRYAVVGALSSYRPHPIIQRIARKEIPLPFEARASKPTYYGEQGNAFQEYLYCTEQFFMGTLYDPTAGDQITGQIWPQTTQFKLAVRTADNTVVFGMANGFHGHHPVEGKSPYDQYHQHRGAAINVCHVSKPDDKKRTAHRSLMAVPAAAGEPVKKGEWLYFAVHKTYVAVRPLGTNTRFVDLADWTLRTKGPAKDGTAPKTAEFANTRFLQTDGTTCGWIVDTATAEQYPTLDAFIAAHAASHRLDLSQFQNARVEYTSLAGDKIALQHTKGQPALGGKPRAWTNGKELSFKDWPVFESPFVTLKNQSLNLSDGKESLTIDYAKPQPTWTHTPASR